MWFGVARVLLVVVMKLAYTRNGVKCVHKTVHRGMRTHIHTIRTTDSLH